MTNKQTMKAIENEHKAWLDLFDVMMKTFKVSREELNKEEYRKVFVFIERWAYFDRERRKQHPDYDKYKGMFYEGEEKI